VSATLAFAQDKPAQDKPEEILNAVVGVSAKIRPDARSAESLGTQRRGSGVLVREGYVLTIGYLVIEAEAIQVTGATGAPCRPRSQATTTPRDSACSSWWGRLPASRWRLAI